jgi:nitrile hydratase accessory protein
LPTHAPPSGATVLRADQVTAAALKGGRNRAELATAPRFALGERLMMSRDNPPTHTRLPAYARGCTGKVVAWHGGFDFADTQAQGIHDVADHLYTVRFEAVPIFAEPWQAKAFAITVTLSRSGLITWPGWAATLGAEIALHPQRPGEGGEAAYYRHWVAALEKLLAARNIATSSTSRRWPSIGGCSICTRRTAGPWICTAIRRDPRLNRSRHGVARCIGGVCL